MINFIFSKIDLKLQKLAKKGGILMEKKTSELLAYIIMKHPRLPVTSLMKLSYLIDLVYIKKTSKQISKFKYARYKYGPFEDSIYKYLKKLVQDEIIKEDSDFTTYGEYIVYFFNDENQEFEFSHLTNKEKETADEVIESLMGFGAKALVELAYKTKPMQKIGATVGGSENLNAILDLRAN
jgi:uncharacterized phage-associated protein